jgi:hypothetical protein
VADLSEQFTEQWRLMRQAPIPHASALFVLAGLMFAAFQLGVWAHHRTKGCSWDPEGPSERIDYRTRRSSFVEKSSSVALPSRDPDALYQFGALVARAPSGQQDRANGVVSFHIVLGGPNHNIHGTVEQRQYSLSDCRFETSSEEGKMAGESHRELSLLDAARFRGFLFGLLFAAGSGCCRSGLVSPNFPTLEVVTLVGTS